MFFWELDFLYAFFAEFVLEESVVAVIGTAFVEVALADDPMSITGGGGYDEVDSTRGAGID